MISIKSAAVISRHALAFAVAASLVACALFLTISGARLGASSVALLVASASLATVAWSLARAGQALLAEPAAEEVELATGRRRKELEREKQGLLKALKELEFDHEMGKISDLDFRDIAASYRARAMRVMRRLDDVAGDYRRMIELDIAAKRGGRPASEVSANEPAPAPVAEASAIANETPSALRVRCASCGADNEADARFCKRCGGLVAAGAAS